MRTHKSLPVLNTIRCTVFVLIYLQLFVLNLWLVPFFANMIVAAILIATLPMIYFSSSLRSNVGKQVFDRIKLRSQFVEYDSGLFGDSWDRPYSEFRVHCQGIHFGLFKLYLVRLKHRVIGNSVLKATFSKSLADQSVKDIVDNSRLGFTRN